MIDTTTTSSSTVDDDHDDGDDDNKDRLETSLQCLLRECRILLELLAAVAAGGPRNKNDQQQHPNNNNNKKTTTTTTKKFQIPRVRFGKTGLLMPIVTLGCMRFQQEWGGRITTMNQVGSDVQDNLLAILHYAISLGMVHIETARGYGCSELQLGVALQQLFTMEVCQRSDLILQTKVPPHADPAVFRAALDQSFINLQVDYIDLFAFHGLNFEEQYDWVFGKTKNSAAAGGGDDSNVVPDCCLAVVRDYVQRGKIKHIGFSTHGSTEFICRCIETNVFAYVNLHYHYFGSYTASGRGNIDAVRLLHEKDMGRFIISPFDKGGRLYAPSHRLCHLTWPDMEPMTFQSWWIWNHHQLQQQQQNNDDNNTNNNNTEGLPLHTYTVGAGRPSDLDQPLVAAYLHATQPERTLDQLRTVVGRLDAASLAALGADWMARWWQGLPKNTGSQYLVEHNQMVWINNNIVAFGLYEFGKARYASFESNEAKWDDKKSDRDNIVQNIGQNVWGFVPGRTLRLDTENGVDYTVDLQHVPTDQLQRVKDAEQFVYDHCRSKAVTKSATAAAAAAATNATGTTTTKMVIPDEWKTAYDLRPWPDYPDRPSRGG